MKELKSEIRMYVAETLIIWAFKIVPMNKEGLNFYLYLNNYCKSILNQNKDE